MSKKILIIEDDRALRKTTAAFLETGGFRIQQVPDGVQGLKADEKDKPDLILLDMMLPAKGGIEVCRVLREKGSEVPIIFISGGSATAGRKGPDPGNRTTAERSI